VDVQFNVVFVKSFRLQLPNGIMYNYLSFVI
jgi:hypothetical protein